MFVNNGLYIFFLTAPKGFNVLLYWSVFLMSHLNFIEEFFISLCLFLENIFIILNKFLLYINFLLKFSNLVIPLWLFIEKTFLVCTLKDRSDVLDLILVLCLHKINFFFPIFYLIFISFDMIFKLFIQMILC